MVITTTFEILAQFQSVMAELTDAYTSKKYKFERNYKGKRFPYFVYDTEKAYSRQRTSRRYMTGKYHSTADCVVSAHHRCIVDEIMGTVFKRQFRARKQTLAQRGTIGNGWDETEEEYCSAKVNHLIQKIQEEDPATIQHYRDWLLSISNAEQKADPEAFYQKYYKSFYSLGIVEFISTRITCPAKKINPYYSKYNVGRVDTNVCEPLFYSHLFTGSSNFSLLKIKYAKGGKITNSGLTATVYTYSNCDSSHYRYESHSKKDDLEGMCLINDIKMTKGAKKYEDLAKLLKEKLP